MKSSLVLVLLCPGLFAETLTILGEAGDWRFSFRVLSEQAVSGKAALEHSNFVAWHQGLAVPVDGHKVELSRGAWGYTLTLQANEASPRITIFNHTSLGQLWFDSAEDVIKLRPGWYRFGGGHSLGVDGATAMLRIEGEVEATGAETSAFAYVLLLAGLLAGAGLTILGGRRPDDALQAFPEAGISPRDANQNHA